MGVLSAGTIVWFPAPRHAQSKIPEDLVARRELPQPRVGSCDSMVIALLLDPLTLNTVVVRPAIGDHRGTASSE